VAALHQGAPGQMTYDLAGRSTALAQDSANSVNRK